MINKKSFIAYCEWRETFQELSDTEAGRLVKHLFDYVNDLNPQTEDKLTKMCFIPIKQSLKRDLVKYEDYIDKQRVNGAKGGRPKNPTLSKKTQPFSEKPKKADNVNDSDNVNDNVNDINKRKADFKKSLLPFLEKYKKEMLKEFFEYWTEHGERDRKMRFEKEKSFGISRRLSTWHSRQKSFDKEKSSGKKEKISGAKSFLNQFPDLANKI